MARTFGIRRTHDWQRVEGFCVELASGADWGLDCQNDEVVSSPCMDVRRSVGLLECASDGIYVEQSSTGLGAVGRPEPERPLPRGLAWYRRWYWQTGQDRVGPSFADRFLQRMYGDGSGFGKLF